MLSYTLFKIIFATLTILLVSTVGHPIDAVISDDDGSNMDEKGSYFGGDMILPPGIDPLNGFVNDSYRWPDQKLIYYLDPNFTGSEFSIIFKAMREIEGKTCLRFQSRNNERDYINITRGEPGTGCYSAVGRVGGSQQLNLEPTSGVSNLTCFRKGTIMHEMLHAIGFLHEHMREDRDKYVFVLLHNVKAGTEQNFKKEQKTLRYNITYDYGSLMHYSKYAFAINDSVPTIVPFDTAAEIGQRKRLSEKDIYKLNAMYCDRNNGKVYFLYKPLLGFILVVLGFLHKRIE